MKSRVFGTVAAVCLWMVFLVVSGFFANQVFAESSGKELVVTSKRLEATREGIEDYVYLCLLKDALEKAGGKAPAGLLVEAKKVLAESPQTVLSDLKNTSLADTAKERVLKVLTRISGNLKP